MAVKSYNFYSVLMPDGIEYWISSWGKKKIAEQYNVPVKNVRVGANLARQPHISEYKERNMKMNRIRYDVPERNMEPPDEPLPEYLTCIICEDDFSEEDMVQVRGKAICIWCADDCGMTAR